SGAGHNAAGQYVDKPDTAALPAFWGKVLGRDQGSGGRAGQPGVPRSQVHVTVRNGAGTKGLATQTGQQLQNLGFRVTATLNAARTAQTLIRYGAGQEGAARTLAAVVPRAQLQADDSVTGITLVLGSDFGGLTGTGGASAGSPAGQPTTGGTSAGKNSSPVP